MSPTYEITTTQEFMAAMGDPRRMRILEILTKQQASATEIAKMIEESPQTTQYHVKVLEKVGLVELVAKREVRGAVEKFYRAVAEQFVFTEKIGEAPGIDTAMLDYATEWMQLGRLEVETGDEPAVLNVTVQGVKCDGETAKQFDKGPLAEANRQWRECNRDEEEDVYILVTALFRIPRDTTLPEKPEAIFVSGKDLPGEMELGEQEP